MGCVGFSVVVIIAPCEHVAGTCLLQLKNRSYNCELLYFKFLEDKSPFCGASDIPVSDFW